MSPSIPELVAMVLAVVAISRQMFPKLDGKFVYGFAALVSVGVVLDAMPGHPLREVISNALRVFVFATGGARFAGYIAEKAAPKPLEVGTVLEATGVSTLEVDGKALAKEVAAELALRTATTPRDPAVPPPLPPEDRPL